jgi:hypothetical protein
MTYVIGLRNNGKNYLMIDCVSSGNGDDTYTTKLFDLEPERLFVGLSGTPILMNILYHLYNWNYLQGTPIDFRDDDSINSFIDCYNIWFGSNPMERIVNEQRFYFLDEDGIFIWDIRFHNGTYQDSEIILINDDEYYLCFKDDSIRIDEQIDDHFQFCKEKIIEYNEELSIRQDNVELLDFKEKFHFVSSDEMIIKDPSNDLTEYITLNLTDVLFSDI